jgi:hypothetical protein
MVPGAAPAGPISPYRLVRWPESLFKLPKSHKDVGIAPSSTGIADLAV